MAKGSLLHASNPEIFIPLKNRFSLKYFIFQCAILPEHMVFGSVRAMQIKTTGYASGFN